MARYKFRYKQARDILYRKMEQYAMDFCTFTLNLKEMDYHEDRQEHGRLQDRVDSSWRKFKACRHGFKKMVRKSIRKG